MSNHCTNKHKSDLYPPGFWCSPVNQVVAKRMAKKQQMQWTHEGAHYLLQTRTAVLNDELNDHFERWYPGLKIGDKAERREPAMKIAA